MGQSKTTSSGTATARLAIGPSQIGNVNFVFLLLTVIAQLATILISWEVWQFRDVAATIPNLAWYGTPPQFDFGYALVATLVFTLISPRYLGLGTHLLVLGLAASTDQLRCQPQVIAVTVLMIACVFPAFKKFAVWFLISMWFWAGLHKFLSPDWMGDVTYHLLFGKQFDWGALRLWNHHRIFAILIATAELGLGVLAWRRPKLAAWVCFFSHVAIAIFLITIQWNFSVLPWNFCTAIVGAWLLWTVSVGSAPAAVPISKRGKAAVLISLLLPIGFYLGFVRHSLCHVLYSANFPDAIITSDEGPKTFEAIRTLGMPFPHDSKAFIDFFKLTGQPGWKLHIREYRWGLGSQHFVLDQQKKIQEITRREFLDIQNSSLAGIEFDDRRKLFQLAKAFHQASVNMDDNDPAISKILKRKANHMAWAIQFNPDSFDKNALRLLDGLPNLEQVQLGGCDISDDDLRYLSGLIRLQGIGLNDTAITDAGLQHLQDLPQLIVIHADRTSVSPKAIERIVEHAN